VQPSNVFRHQLILLLGGVLFATHAEIGVLFLLISALVDLTVKNYFCKWNFSVRGFKVFFSIVALFCFIRILLSFQTPEFWRGLLESCLVISMLIFGLWIKNSDYKSYFSKSTSIGIALLLLIIGIPRATFIFFGGSLQWFHEPSLTNKTQIGDVFLFQPIADNSWVLQNSTMQGAGRVRYQFEVRAKTAFETTIGFIHSSLANGRTDNPCFVSKEWRICSVEVELSKRDSATLGIGGFGKWNTTSPTLEIRNPKIVVIVPPKLSDVIFDFSRVMGFSFNENAFGAHMVILGLLAFAFIADSRWTIFTFLLTFIGLFSSGSRGALAAFTFGLFVLFLTRSRAYKLLPWVIVLAFTTIAIFQAVTIRGSVSPIVPSSQTGLRSLNVADQDSARGRLEIWRLATKSWLENPRTFLIGTGDLASAMKVKHDARAVSFGLTKDSLTHAHNLWIQTAGESGLLGLSAMITLWCWVVWKSWKSRDAGALALLAAIFVINSVDYLFYYAPVHLAFWMAAAGLKPPDNKELEAQPATT
jgi:hypothetical protein